MLVKNIKDNKSLFVMYVIVITCHIVLHDNFRKESMDDPWVLSWVYNYFYYGIDYDSVFAGKIGGTGLQLFGKTYAYLYGSILHVVGFAQYNAHLISKFFMAFINPMEPIWNKSSYS